MYALGLFAALMIPGRRTSKPKQIPLREDVSKPLPLRGRGWGEVGRKGITFGDPFWGTSKAFMNPSGIIYFPFIPLKKHAFSRDSVK